MKRTSRARLGVAATLFLILLSAGAGAFDIPPYRTAVNDLAEVLSPAEERRLQQRIEAYRDSTGIEIGILTVESLDGAPAEDVAHDVFHAWGIGDKTRNNGVLLLVAWQDRVARLEVGYGLEGSLTDLEAGRIVSRQSAMAEQFREGDVAGGLTAVLDGIQAAVAGDYDPPEKRSETQPWQGQLVVFLAVMMFIVFMAAVARRRARRLGVWGRGSWGGDGWGGFGGLGGLGGFGRGLGGGQRSGGGFHFGGGSSGGGGATGGW